MWNPEDLIPGVTFVGRARPVERSDERRRRLVRFNRAIIIGSLALVIAANRPAAAAVDGVREINQACANGSAATSCFAGDTPGLPVQITQPGSYRLTSDLVVPDLSTVGISVSTDDVTIDLNGFGVRGPNVCTPASCNGFGLGYGITKETILDNRSRITVRNGRISGFGGVCIALGDEAHVEGVSVSGCGGSGIVVGAHSTVLGNRIVSVRLRGLFLGADSAFADNVIALAGLGGVPGLSESVIGGRATGGNVCDDNRCSTNPAMRRFYPSQNSSVVGSAAPTSCASGFHFASLWEILDVSHLAYDTGLGFTTADSGSGPPSAASGWVRTGYSSSNNPPVEGQSNCNAWTSGAFGDHGTAAFLSTGWRTGDASTIVTSPWFGFYDSCSNSTRVWCVQD